jgi:hypothetical protein
MTGRRLSAFLDALATGRRPRRFRADADDIDVLRTAIALRAARPGDAAPSEAFVDGLFQQLSDQANHHEGRTGARPASTHRARTALMAAAAAAVLVAGTAITTESLDHPRAAHSAAGAPQGSALRTGTFQTAGGQVLGQIVAYRGDPSWVFMNVAVPNYTGSIRCTLQVDDGSTVAFGTFVVNGGSGQFSKTIAAVDVAHLRGAKLVTSTGAPVGSATFAS